MPRRTGERALRAARALAVTLLAALAMRAAADDVRLEAHVDRTSLALGESVTLEVRLESPEPPTSLELKDDPELRIVSRSSSRQVSYTAGPGGLRARQVLVARLGLEPQRAGAVVIPPVVATIGGVRHETKPIALTVSPAAGGGPSPGTSAAPDPDPPEPPAAAASGGAFHGWERDLVLEVRPDRREVWLGEQITVSIWLYSPLGVVEYERFSPPRHDGFWEEELETPKTIQYQVRTVNGVPTRAYLLQRIALFPTRAGALELGPAELHLGVRVGGGSLFDPFPEVKRVSRRSRPVVVQVRPLPAGAPPGFESVNVGKLSIGATASDGQVAVGQPVTVRITATGDGNVRALALPRLPAIPGAKAFEPTISESVAPRGARLAGSRTLETVLVPEAEGELVVPRVAWSWFDPEAGRYEAAETPELRVRIVPGAGGAGGATAAAASSAPAAALRPIRADPGLSRRGGPPWRSPLFAAALALPPLAFAALALADRVRARAGRSETRRRGAARTARRRLARARAALARGASPEALGEVERALTGYATDRLGRPAAGLTRDALGAALARAGGHPPATRALLAALEACEAVRYGGGSGAPAEVLDAAERAIALLEEADWRPEAEGVP
jgi:hypothetical protein